MRDSLLRLRQFYIREFHLAPRLEVGNFYGQRPGVKPGLFRLDCLGDLRQRPRWSAPARFRATVQAWAQRRAVSSPSQRNISGDRSTSEHALNFTSDGDVAYLQVAPGGWAVVPNIGTKLEKKIAFAAHLALIMPTPCGCIPTPIVCGCLDSRCVCDLDLNFCEHAPDWPSSFLGSVGDFLVAVDPVNYGEPPIPDEPILIVSREARIDILAARVESGSSTRHPGDCHVDDFKAGEVTERCRNGAVQGRGAGESVGRPYRTRWRGHSERHALTGTGWSDRTSVEDLITESER